MYFASVAALVLLAGYFYFNQMKTHLLKAEEFRLLEYARHIKMGGPKGEFPSDFRHRFIPAGNRHIDIANLRIENGCFVKLVPLRFGDRYLEVCRSTAAYERRLGQLKLRIVAAQALLLLLFGLLSYRLAKNAIRPLQESIELLDHFVKDLIHDLNTPVTAIKLNLTVLEQMSQFRGLRVLQRLQKSVRTISELHENLTILLEEKTFQTRETDLCPLVREVVEIQRPLYPEIAFEVSCHDFRATVHPKAFKQMLQNIVSNACRYNKPQGYVRIYRRGRTLIVEDSGIGIDDPEKIFERDYSGRGGSGLGLDIVRRLAMAMQVEVAIENAPTGGTRFTLTFA